MTNGFRLLAISLCLGVSSVATARAAQSDALVILGPTGSVVRVLTTRDVCPAIVVDGRKQTMTVRASAGKSPQRPTQSTQELSKPSSFPILTCEATVPRAARSARVEGSALPLPKRDLKRIVVIGDTGCRLKASDNAYQACNDAKAYPFARIAERAAAWKPDAVIHVGDLLYRENPCPPDKTGCSGSPWGYGYDAWRADFFAPAAALLKAAPWIMTRGNHENCMRAGQGWWRFIDPRPLDAKHDCNDAANDAMGDVSAPYAVSLGGGAQVVVLDLSIAGTKPLEPGDDRMAAFQAAYRDLERLSERATFTFALDHYPVFGVAAERQGEAVALRPGNAALQSAFSIVDPAMSTPNVDVWLSGHVHLWEQTSFQSAHPSQFIAGFSGTQEDIVPLPEMLPPDVAPVPGARVARFSSWVNGFGYMTLERTGGRKWRATIWDVNGRPVNHCTIVGKRSLCDVAQVRTKPE